MQYRPLKQLELTTIKNQNVKCVCKCSSCGVLQAHSQALLCVSVIHDLLSCSRKYSSNDMITKTARLINTLRVSDTFINTS